MRISGFGRPALNIWVAAALLAGCGGVPQPIGAAGAMPQTCCGPSSVKYEVLYSFGGSGDGVNPYAGLFSVKGTLYGTTQYGGGAGGEGTVFSVSASGKETVLHSFGPYGEGDGEQPYAGLMKADGKLYGTTERGGTHGWGSVFKVTPAGKESVLHSFGGAGDGEEPNAGLIALNGTLYGTTALGGANGDGIVFAITDSGVETVLHNFGGAGDGVNPQAALLNVKGTLYGTTEGGGAKGAGTVFTITP
ncbi:MAG TPA: choice-of-anchor tandem repeat GloVer-containing protein [Candidatus Cybelea sp.]|nr:choice-of-anchor tandem repeat GloVer-containing protein [Candidatus Cybelea sp.]